LVKQYEREYNFHDNAPRLARLTEAEILELAEIDYASVGNMPPRSERDEQHLPSINDLSGLGRMSNTSDQTQTTMLDSISMASADIDVLQSEANSRSITHESPCDDYASAGNARDAHSADLDIDTVDSISDRNGNLNHLQNDRMIVDASPHNNPTLAVTALALAGQSSSSPQIAAVVPMDPVDHLELSKTPGKGV